MPPGLPANLMSLVTGMGGATASASPATNKPPPHVITTSKPKIAPAQPEETPAQKQAAAKLALRKQLEKTLLQASTTLRGANYNCDV